MKKSNYLVLLIVLLCLLFSSCSKAGDDTENKLQFVQVNVTSDDSNTPTGIVALFYLGSSKDYAFASYDLKECPIVASSASGKIIGAYRNDGEQLFPISDVGGNKLLSVGNKGVCTFYWDNLSTLYGTPQAGGKYAIFIKLNCGNYPRAYKVITIDKNKKIDVHIPSASKSSECVEANWNMTDYVSD
jgi:hypothetical protein